MASKLGFDTKIITLVSSCEKPPCSASLVVLPEYVTPTFGATAMSGLRGSPFGGMPGGLNS